MNIDEILGPILQMRRPLLSNDSMETVAAWDSACHVDVILAVEEALGRDLTATEISRITSIREIVGLLRGNGLDVELPT